MYPPAPPPVSTAPLPTLKASASSPPKALAGAIAAGLQRSAQLEVHAVGPHAINQATKALAIARGYLEDSGRDLIVQPDFAEAEGGGVQIVLLVTAIQRV